MSENKADLKDLLNKVVQAKADTNRRYIDEILERIQDQNHQYYLQRLGYELREMELAEKAGNLQLVMHHKVMADTFKSILENCFSGK
jgi:hypothetical protein